MCLYSMKEETEAIASRSRGKGSIKESAITKDRDKKVKDSQNSKRRTSAKTKVKGLDQSHGSIISDFTEQEQRHENLELKRNQRQE